jgi:sphingomyelin phosphodiesterase acid-like 3
MHGLKRYLTRGVLCVLLLLRAFPIYPAPRGPNRHISGTGTVVSLSDIHFNPFFDPSLLNTLIQSDYTTWQGIFSHSRIEGYGTHSADSNYNLLNSTLENVYEVAPHPDFIIISGDFLAHDFQETFAKLSGSSDRRTVASFIDKTISFVTRMIARRFPNTPVYPALGNNDSYCGDYQIDPNGPFLRATAKIWKGLFKNRSNARSFLRTFPVSGSYSISSNKHAHRLIVLNNTFFSINYKNSCGDPKSDPGRDELKWLEVELEKVDAANGKVWLVYHIPPGIDVFSTLHQTQSPNGQMPQIIPFWRSAYNERFINLVMRHSTNIIGSFAGHMHMDTFELIQADNGKAVSFVHITPAISPLFGNNPAFELFSYNRQSFAPKDYTTYYLDLSSAASQRNAPIKWQKEYSFVESYGQSNFSASTLQEVQKAIPANQSDYGSKFETYYDVSNAVSQVVGPTNWRAYWCGMTNLTLARYLNCLPQSTSR